MKPWIPEQVLGAGEIAGHPRQSVWNAFVGLIGQPLPLADGASLSLAQGAAPAPDERLMQIETASPAGTLLCRLVEFPFAQLTGSDLSAGDIDALPEPLAQAVCTGVVSVLTGMLPADWMTEARLAGLLRGDAHAIAGMDEWFDATVAAPGIPPVALKIGLRRDWLMESLAQHLSPGIGGTGPGSLGLGPLAATLTTPADVTLGRLGLTASELKAIEPGDVVVMAAAAEDSVCVRVAGRLFSFFPSDGQYACGGSQPLDAPRPATFRSEISAMTDNDPQEQAAMQDQGADHAGQDHPGGLADLVLAVDFDIGRIDIPMATVAGWTPGTLIQMQQPALDSGVPVTIRINGQPVGTGDIVRIDDRIGVRITRLIS